MTATREEIRRSRIFIDAERMLATWFDGSLDLSPEDTIETLAAFLMWELAVDEDGILTPDAAKEVYENVGFRLTELVD